MHTILSGNENETKTFSKIPTYKAECFGYNKNRAEKKTHSLLNGSVQEAKKFPANMKFKEIILL